MLGTASHLERSTLAPRRELSVTHRCRGTATLRCAAVSENTHKKVSLRSVSFSCAALHCDAILIRFEGCILKVQSASQTHGLAVAVPRMLAAAAASIILTGQPAWSDIQVCKPLALVSTSFGTWVQAVRVDLRRIQIRLASVTE